MSDSFVRTDTLLRKSLTMKIDFCLNCPLDFFKQKSNIWHSILSCWEPRDHPEGLNPTVWALWTIPSSASWFTYLILSSVLFCSVLFCSVLFCSVLFCSLLFSSLLFSYQVTILSMEHMIITWETTGSKTSLIASSIAPCASGDTWCRTTCTVE